MARRSVYTALALVVLVGPGLGQEIEGFRLGMTIEQSRALGASKGYTFSNPVATNTSAEWMNYVLMKDGPTLSFCRNILSGMTKQYTSNTHEFVSLLTGWEGELGEPVVSTSQNYIRGQQHSDVTFTWTPTGNVRRTLSLIQFAANGPQISYGFSLIKHPCTAT